MLDFHFKSNIGERMRFVRCCVFLCICTWTWKHTARISIRPFEHRLRSRFCFCCCCFFFFSLLVWFAMKIVLPPFIVAWCRLLCVYSMHFRAPSFKTAFNSNRAYSFTQLILICSDCFHLQWRFNCLISSVCMIYSCSYQSSHPNPCQLTRAPIEWWRFRGVVVSFGNEIWQHWAYLHADYNL